jgi:hypothetical protein
VGVTRRSNSRITSLVLVKLNKVGVNLRLPFLEVSGEWAPDDLERQAAWELYVELVTRVPVSKLQEDEGVLREALASLYGLFGTTRAILRKYGPGVALGKEEGTLSFGYMAVALLNGALRPFLAKWHPLLQTFEAKRPSGTAPAAHEATWDAADDMRRELDELRVALVDYAVLLGEVTRAPSLLRAVEDMAR